MDEVARNLMTFPMAKGSSGVDIPTSDGAWTIHTSTATLRELDWAKDAESGDWYGYQTFIPNPLRVSFWPFGNPVVKSKFSTGDVFAIYVDMDLNGYTNEAAPKWYYPLGNHPEPVHDFPDTTEGVTGRDTYTFIYTVGTAATDGRFTITTSTSAVENKKIRWYGFRIDRIGTIDELGVFSGATEDKGGTVYEWEGTPYESESIAYADASAEPVTAAAPTFDDTAPEYTIPATPNVVYSVEGAQQDAGTYPAAWLEKVTVTAEGAEGYAVEGDAEWSHTFPRDADILAINYVRFPNFDTYPDNGPGTGYSGDYRATNDHGQDQAMEVVETPTGNYLHLSGSGTTEQSLTLTIAMATASGMPPGPYQLHLDIDMADFPGSLTFTTPGVVPGNVSQGTGRGVQVFDIPDVEWIKLDLIGKLARKIHIYGARLSLATDYGNGLGIFSGATPDVSGIAYEWTGEPFKSASRAIVGAEIEPDPDLEPDPGMPATGPLASRVMAMLGLDAEDEDVAQLAQESVTAIGFMVKAYTRGKGFNSAGEPAADVQSVILTASARYIANPSGLTYRAGTEWVSDAFKGWTLAEQFTLNNYRKRWN